MELNKKLFTDFLVMFIFIKFIQVFFKPSIVELILIVPVFLFVWSIVERLYKHKN